MDRYTLNHSVQKQSIINSHKAFAFSDKEHLQTELNHLKKILEKNGHNKKYINKVISKH